MYSESECYCPAGYCKMGYLWFERPNCPSFSQLVARGRATRCQPADNWHIRMQVTRLYQVYAGWRLVASPRAMRCEKCRPVEPQIGQCSKTAG